MKYINSDKLCEDLMTRWHTADKEKETAIQRVMADIVVPIVIGQPSADVVEVVRCKDCVHFHISQPIQGKEITECTREGYEYDAASVKPDDFCSYGERKESKVKKCFDIPKEVAERLLEDTERKETE